MFPSCRWSTVFSSRLLEYKSESLVFQLLSKMTRAELKRGSGRAQLLGQVSSKRGQEAKARPPVQSQLLREEQDKRGWKFAMGEWAWLGGDAGGFEGLAPQEQPGKQGGKFCCGSCHPGCNFLSGDQAIIYDHMVSVHLKRVLICAWCGVAASESRRYLKQHINECYDLLVDAAAVKDAAR